jgi:hypothetical protein
MIQNFGAGYFDEPNSAFFRGKMLSLICGFPQNHTKHKMFCMIRELLWNSANHIKYLLWKNVECLTASLPNPKNIFVTILACAQS